MSNERLLGQLREEGGLGVVRIEDVYATPIDDLWSALTQPSRLRRWIADVTGDLRVGGAFAATFTSGWEGTGIVEICDAPHRLLVTTQRPGHDSTVMEAVLTSEDDQRTRLVIEERGLPLEDYADHGAGWQAHAEDLQEHVNGREPGNWADRWRQLSAAYFALSGR